MNGYLIVLPLMFCSSACLTSLEKNVQEYIPVRVSVYSVQPRVCSVVAFYWFNCSNASFLSSDTSCLVFFPLLFGQDQAIADMGQGR
jgi:hypothetical protein